MTNLQKKYSFENDIIDKILKLKKRDLQYSVGLIKELMINNFSLINLKSQKYFLNNKILLNILARHYEKGGNLFFSYLINKKNLNKKKTNLLRKKLSKNYFSLVYKKIKYSIFYKPYFTK